MISKTSTQIWVPSNDSLQRWATSSNKQCFKWHQSKANRIYCWLCRNRKTTIIKEILSKLPNFRVCAFTGKATNILRRKGIHSAETIHSTIYDVKKDEDKVKYSIKPFSKLLLDGFIIDEASMISEEIYKDLCYYEKPIIFVGDHGQLPPIGKQILT